MYRNILFVVFLLIFTSRQQSNASLVQIFRKLAEGHNPKNITIPVVSPSPSPVSSLNLSPVSPSPNKTKTESPGNGEVQTESPKVEPIDGITDERCDTLSNGCHGENITACINRAGIGSQVSFLLVQNEGESSLKVSIRILPASTTIYKEIELLKTQAKKINISEDDVKGIKAIVLQAGHGDCIIHMGSPPPPPPQNDYYKQFSSYATYVKPVHGAYLLILTATIIGGTWACCRFHKTERHLEGVPYQELEMGQQPESLSATNVESTDGWDQGWDDDWDEEKAAGKSPPGQENGHSREENGRGNGFTSRSANSEGWDDNWDD